MASILDVKQSIIGKFGYVNTDLVGHEIWNCISVTKSFNKYSRLMGRLWGGING